MKIRFIKPATAAGFGYRENETGDLPPDAAKMLIEKGFAVEVERKREVPETRESKAAPERRTRTKGKKK